MHTDIRSSPPGRNPSGTQGEFSGGSRFGSTRFGSVIFEILRFGSVTRPVPAGSGMQQTVRFGSVRPVRFLIPSCHHICGAPSQVPA